MVKALLIILTYGGGYGNNCKIYITEKYVMEELLLPKHLENANPEVIPFKFKYRILNTESGIIKEINFKEQVRIYDYNEATKKGTWGVKGRVVSKPVHFKDTQLFGFPCRVLREKITMDSIFTEERIHNYFFTYLCDINIVRKYVPDLYKLQFLTCINNNYGSGDFFFTLKKFSSDSKNMETTDFAHIDVIELKEIEIEEYVIKELFDRY